MKKSKQIWTIFFYQRKWKLFQKREKEQKWKESVKKKVRIFFWKNKKWMKFETESWKHRKVDKNEKKNTWNEMSSDETSALSAGVSLLHRESWTPPAEAYASQILHVSIDFILLEHLRPEIFYVALWQNFLQVDLLSLHTLLQPQVAQVQMSQIFPIPACQWFQWPHSSMASRCTYLFLVLGDVAPYRQWHITSATTSVTGKLQKETN